METAFPGDKMADTAGERSVLTADWSVVIILC